MTPATQPFVLSTFQCQWLPEVLCPWSYSVRFLCPSGYLLISLLVPPLIISHFLYIVVGLLLIEVLIEFLISLFVTLSTGSHFWDTQFQQCSQQCTCIWCSSYFPGSVLMFLFFSLPCLILCHPAASTIVSSNTVADFFMSRIHVLLSRLPVGLLYNTSSSGSILVRGKCVQPAEQLR